MLKRLQSLIRTFLRAAWSLRGYVVAGLFIVGALVLIAALAGRAQLPDFPLY